MGICSPDFHSSDFNSDDFNTTLVGAFSFTTFIKDRLPNYFHDQDTYKNSDGEGLLIRYLSIFGDEIDQEIIPTIECFLNIIDAQTTDPKFLVHLSDVLGNPPDVFGNDEMYRNLLSYIVSVYKIKGTKPAYELFFSLLGFDIELEEIPLNDQFLEYDTGGEYDNGLVYDMDRCTPCSYYDITFFPKDGSYVFTNDLLVKLRAAIDFNEPINAKLRHLTLGVRLEDSINVKLLDSVETTEQTLIKYDSDNEYDSGLKYDDSDLNAIVVLRTPWRIVRSNTTNKYNFKSEMTHNFTGDIDYGGTNLFIRAYGANNQMIYQSSGTIVNIGNPGFVLEGDIIQNLHTISGAIVQIKVEGLIQLENGLSAQFSLPINNGDNDYTLYFY